VNEGGQGNHSNSVTFANNLNKTTITPRNPFNNPDSLLDSRMNVPISHSAPLLESETGLMSQKLTRNEVPNYVSLTM